MIDHPGVASLAEAGDLNPHSTLFRCSPTDYSLAGEDKAVIFEL
jgi:hypothetical protein